MSHASWLKPLFDPKELGNRADIIAKEINKDKHNLSINSIAVKGTSGLVIGGLISWLTDLPLIIVRDKEASHSEFIVEYPNKISTLSYAIVDDLIDSGATINEIYYKISQLKISQALRKIYLYNPIVISSETTIKLLYGVTIPVFSLDIKK
jgi:adenine/guanine phosphoribosyltransferase-like PRPP-binding protein